MMSFIVFSETRKEKMDVDKYISEITALLDEVLSDVPDNDIYQQYKSRSVLNYVQTLKALLDIKKSRS